MFIYATLTLLNHYKARINQLLVLKKLSDRLIQYDGTEWRMLASSAEGAVLWLEPDSEMTHSLSVCPHEHNVSAHIVM